MILQLQYAIYSLTFRGYGRKFIPVYLEAAEIDGHELYFLEYLRYFKPTHTDVPPPQYIYIYINTSLT